MTPAYAPTTTNALNIYAAAATVLNQLRTGETSRELQDMVVVSGLSGAGSLLTLTRSNGGVMQKTVVATPVGETTFRFPRAEYVALDAESIGMTLRSDNAADTNVSVTVRLWPSIDAAEVASGVSTDKTPFLNRKVDPTKVINLSSRDDGFIVDRPLRIKAGSKETWWLRRIDGEPWHAIQSVPTSSDDTHVEVIDEEESERVWGVKDDHVGFTVAAPIDAQNGDEATLTLMLEPERNRLSVVTIACSVL